MRARYNRSCTTNTTLKYLCKNYPNEGERKNIRNKNLTAAAAVATAAALMLAGCATQKPAASSSEAASTAPAESSVVEETTPEEAPSEVTDVDEAAAEDLLLSTETMHYSADDEDGVVTVHKYDENGNEVFMREIDKASDMDTVIIKELDENGNVLKMASYLNGEQNYLYTQVFNDHGDMIERDDEDGNPSIVCQYTYDDNGRKLSEESYTVSDGEQYLNYSTAYTYDDTHELPVTEVITNDSGVQTTTRDFDTMDVDGLYIETVSEDGADDIVYHKRASDNKTTYYFGQGSEVSTEYDEHGNMTKQQGKDATMGNFEQTFENTYDDNGNLISMKSAYNGDDGYFIDYTYAALNDASYNGEGTLLFDAATDTPSAA